MMRPDVDRSSLQVARDLLRGRAAGAWRVAGDRLELVAFDPAPDLPPGVAEGFAAATSSVGLTLDDLAIVRAARAGRVVVSIASELPADRGSGLWLRAFGASRSVAVPIFDDGGRVVGVLSIALGPEPDAKVVEATILRVVR